MKNINLQDEKEMKEILKKRRETFNKRIMELRINKGKKENRNLTKDQASKEMGIHTNSLNNYEFDRFPKVDQLIRMKNYYNVSYEYLLEEAENKTPNPDYQVFQKETGLSDRATEVLKQLQNNINDPKLNEFSYILKQKIKTINTLIENEATTHILENISDFLWGKYNTTKDPLATIEDGKLKNDTVHDFVTVREEKSGENLAIPISKFNKIYLLDMEEKLMALRERLQGGK